MTIVHFNGYYHTNPVHERLRVLLKTHQNLEHLYNHSLWKICYDIILNRVKVDLVHCHTTGKDGYKGLLLKFLFGCNYVVSVRNTDINYHWKNRILRGYLTIVLKFSSQIVVQNMSYKKRLNGLGFSEVRVVPHFIEDDWIAEESRMISRDDIELIYIGRLSKIDRETYTRILEKSPKIHLKIFTPDIQEINKVLGQKRITVSHKSRDELRLELNGSYVHLFLSPTETFGMAALETMALGIPTIIQRNEGVYDFMEEDLKELACDVKNHLEIEQKLSLIYTNFNYYSARSIAFSRNFSKKSILDLHFEIYSKASVKK